MANKLTLRFRITVAPESKKKLVFDSNASQLDTDKKQYQQQHIVVSRPVTAGAATGNSTYSNLSSIIYEIREKEKNLGKAATETSPFRHGQSEYSSTGSTRIETVRRVRDLPVDISYGSTSTATAYESPSHSEQDAKNKSNKGSISKSLKNKFDKIF